MNFVSLDYSTVVTQTQTPNGWTKASGKPPQPKGGTLTWNPSENEPGNQECNTGQVLFGSYQGQCNL